ncbi:MAG: sulfatase-like hydrolase/transferase, partial [Planctomycetaceae bacterium]
RHAHNHFPDFLWQNEERFPLPNVIHPVGDQGAGYATKAVQFADDLFADRALKFVEDNQERPFFLYWSMVIPHANNERRRELGNGAQVPDFGPYADRDWPDPDKGHAAMITRMDGMVGQLLDRLQQLEIADRTLVIFTSDNGPHRESGHQLERFQPSGPYSGIKRSLMDGGIRVPTLAWWPGQIVPGRTSDHVGYFGDLMATAADLSDAAVPANVDSISLMPTLMGQIGQQQRHEFLYWEFHEGGFQQACLYQGRWKAIRRLGQPVRLFDTDADLAEQQNVASLYPQVAQICGEWLDDARTPAKDWEPKPGKN